MSVFTFFKLYKLVPNQAKCHIKISHKCHIKSPYQLFVDFIPIVVFEIWGMSLLHEAWSQAMLRGEMSLIYTSNSNNPSIEPFGRCNISYVRAELTENVPTVY